MIFRSIAGGALQVPAIAQGCLGLGALSRKSIDEQIAGVRLGVELGMTLLDTAESYGVGDSEEVVGHAVRAIRDKVLIATKCSPEHLRREDVVKAVEGSLARLRTDYIDLYQIHWPNPAVPIGETMDALGRLVECGKIRYCGVSNFGLNELRSAIEVAAISKPIVNQLEFNTLERTVEFRYLDRMQNMNVALLAYSPFLELTTGMARERKDVLDGIAQKYSASAAQIILAWLISDERVTVIVKASTESHLLGNAAAVNLSLEQEDIEKLARAFRREVQLLPPECIQIDADNARQRRWYLTKEAAVCNAFRFMPSPLVLAEHITRNGELLKPLKVTKVPGTSSMYGLVEGQLRYWASVIAHGTRVPVPAYIMDN